MKFDISTTSEFTPEIIYWLQKGIAKIPYCTETVETIWKAVEHNQGCVYTIKLGDELYGILVTSFTKAFPKNFFNLFLVSGKNIELWRDQFEEFIIETTRTLNARLIVTGRKGLKKMFPILKEVGSIYILE